MQSNPIKHLLLAAEKGDAAAQFNLGVLYDSRLDDNGYAIKGNRVEAIKWLLAAAEQGLPRAQSQLATMYAGGPDAPEDYIKACAWFLLATTSLRGIHRHRAQSGYDRISAHLTPAQLAKARRFAGNWKPKRQDKAAVLSDMANGAGAAMAPIAGLLPQGEQHRIVPGPCLPSAASWILRTGSLQY
jgi:TPR repeat protein